MGDNCGDFEWRDKLSAEDKKRIDDMNLYIDNIDASVDGEYPYKNINSELNGLLGELMKENEITTGDSDYDYEWDRLVRSIYKKARKCDEDGQY